MEELLKLTLLQEVKQMKHKVDFRLFTAFHIYHAGASCHATK